MTERAILPLLLSPPWRGVLAAVVCAAWAVAVGVGLTLVDWVEKKHGRS